MREKIGTIKGERAAYDFYATNPHDVKQIIELLDYPKNFKILEPCAGNGHISETLKNLGYKNVFTNDIVERDLQLDSVKDFLKEDLPVKCFDLVVLNPPFKHAKEFIEKSLQYANDVLVIARLDLLETKARKDLNNKHLSCVFVHSKRARFAKNGDEERFKDSTSMSSAWFLYKKLKEETKLIVI